MNAKKCDICGKFYECYAGHQVFKEGSGANALSLFDAYPSSNCCTRREYDLCQDCMQKIWEFIEGRRK